MEYMTLYQAVDLAARFAAKGPLTRYILIIAAFQEFQTGNPSVETVAGKMTVIGVVMV